MESAAVTNLNPLSRDAPKRLQEGLPSIGSLLDRASEQIDGAGLSGQRLSADEQTALHESLQGARTRLSSVSTLGDIFTVDGLLADVRKRLSESPSFAASTELRELDSLIGRARDSLRDLRVFGDAKPELTSSAPSMKESDVTAPPAPPASTVETTGVGESVTTPTETLRETGVAEIAEERPEEAQALEVAEEQSGVPVMQDQVRREQVRREGFHREAAEAWASCKDIDTQIEKILDKKMRKRVRKIEKERDEVREWLEAALEAGGKLQEERDRLTEEVNRMKKKEQKVKEREEMRRKAEVKEREQMKRREEKRFVV
uniref:Uncharacterized protein n=1 Tax=Chromera velia CCMP2878 TaxID=1169474 RepID=A0A0G4HZH0_9ALVE|eukprot:Cvel_9741.t1-p1 / transcript=Cvel_9741.t1 / gene=Cvel_9741 / organism=Chromera_velia_CCMP2878 / gene_product=hypothetical protein / transcript_product=hypothetical protein / location=Cvel_scaffold569:52707-53654(-) / protein_length=316 / sequence_SO=supercontig / SO=protein_coding / is_pseudo=false